MSQERRLAALLGAMTLVILALLLLGAEWIVERAARDPILDAIAADPGYDLRSRDEVLEELAARGEEHLPLLVPATLLQEPLVGADGRPFHPASVIAEQPFVACNESGRWIRFRSDPHGFRNPPSAWESTTDILLCGDSFAMGVCVEDQDELGALLRKDGRGVLNLGIAGNGPLQTLAALREYATHRRPEWVVWMFFENDLGAFDLPIELESEILPNYLEASFNQDLLGRRQEIDEALRRHTRALVDGKPINRSSPAKQALDGPGTLARLERLLSLGELRRRLSAAVAAPQRGINPELLASFRRTLEVARNDVAAWEGRILFVAIPAVWELAENGAANNLALGIANELGIETLDFGEVLRERPDPASHFALPRVGTYSGAPHLGRTGYALLARAIEARLEAHAGSAGAGK